MYVRGGPPPAAGGAAAPMGETVARRWRPASWWPAVAGARSPGVGRAAHRMTERQPDGRPSGQDQGRMGSPELVLQGLKSAGSLPNERIASVVYLGERLAKPVLVEGPAGTGKTELAKSVAAMSNMRLIRLQCYEGLDEAKALYEWNYKKQLLRIQAEQVRRPAGSP